MTKQLYRRDIRFPPEVNRELEVLKTEMEEKLGKSISMSRLVVEIVRQHLALLKNGLLSSRRGVDPLLLESALRKEEEHAPRSVRPNEDEGAA
jgi:hypothetical protein